ncbi:MAG: MobQ family relaxase [Lachnospiraceae bacterium]|nr:MobQ family relaxase [Lachnospiraceae bacterium]
MALYHFSTQIISRSNGQSACAAAAYRSGEKIENKYDGITHDYRLKQNVEDAIVLLPENAPADFADRSKLWNSIEQNEKQGNAQLSREIEFSLPRELSPEVRKQIALGFIQERFVDQGMVADVCFHNPPKMNSKKQPIDVNGNPTLNPSQYIYENPHVHVMLTLRPLNEMGKWESKKTKLYVCEKDGEQKLFSAASLKEVEGWEKLFNYKMSSGKKEWHTKTYAEEHKDECIELVNRYPKCEQAVNPIVEKWNNPNNVELWRAAWAEKINIAYEMAGIDITVDHRSYERQGLDLIPTVHEGKAVTIAEKKLKEEYELKIANGEPAFIKHTDIRNLNNAIKMHNNEIKIIAEMKKLQAQMQELIKPVVERLEQFGQSISEKLERIRAEIIVTSLRLKKSVEVKGKADGQIVADQQYIKDLAPIRKERLEELQLQLKSLKREYDGMNGLFQAKKKEELAERIENLQGEVELYKENRKYAVKAQKEIDGLMITSDKVGHQIEELQVMKNTKVDEYKKIESLVTESDILLVRQERFTLRPSIEKEYELVVDKMRFQNEACAVDRKLGCSLSDLLGISNVTINAKFGGPKME